MNIISTYWEVGTFRGAAELCGTTHKTVKRVVERAEAGGEPPQRESRPRNFDAVCDLVAERVAKSARISAKRLLPIARAAGYEGSARNFRSGGAAVDRGAGLSCAGGRVRRQHGCRGLVCRGQRRGALRDCRGS